MTITVRKDNGQFNGSIGEGAKHVPTAPPTAPAATGPVIEGARPVMPGVVPARELSREEALAALDLIAEAQEVTVVANGERLGWGTDHTNWQFSEEETACFESGVAYGLSLARQLLSAPDPNRVAQQHADSSLSYLEDWEQHDIALGEEAARLMRTARRNQAQARYLAEGYDQDEAAAAAYLEHP
jgi:hypothetical protein